MNDMFAIKDTGILSVTKKDTELIKVDFLNKVGHITTINKKEILFLHTEMLTDELLAIFMSRGKADFKIEMKCKDRKTGEYFVSELVYRDMNLVKFETSFDSDLPSEFIFIFTNGRVKSKEIKEEINRYLDNHHNLYTKERYDRRKLIVIS